MSVSNETTALNGIAAAELVPTTERIDQPRARGGGAHRGAASTCRCRQHRR